MVAIVVLSGLISLDHQQPGRTRWLFLSSRVSYTIFGTQPFSVLRLIDCVVVNPKLPSVVPSADGSFLYFAVHLDAYGLSRFCMLSQLS